MEYICTVDGDYNEPCVLETGNVNDCDIAVKIKKENGNCSWCKYYTTKDVYYDRIDASKKIEEQLNYNYKVAEELKNKILENDIKLINFMTTFPEKENDKKIKNKDIDKDDGFSFW